jgi:hypothetical protein
MYSMLSRHIIQNPRELGAQDLDIEVMLLPSLEVLMPK